MDKPVTEEAALACLCNAEYKGILAGVLWLCSAGSPCRCLAPSLPPALLPSSTGICAVLVRLDCGDWHFSPLLSSHSCREQVFARNCPKVQPSKPFCQSDQLSDWCGRAFSCSAAVSTLSICLASYWRCFRAPSADEGARDTGLTRCRAAEEVFFFSCFSFATLARLLIVFFGFPLLTPLLPHIDHRNRGMRTRLGCLSHKSDSYNDFTAILPDKPNRALK